VYKKRFLDLPGLSHITVEVERRTLSSNMQPTSLQGSRSGALSANAASFALLWAYRSGDANMRSAWVCTRNDVLGNLAVLLAALGVFGTKTGWPDLIVASTMAALALQGAWIVISQSQAELHISAAHDIVKGATSR
jgi:Co/Zn/Cd efflux system component